MHLQIAAQARRAPEAVAVVAEDGRLTYGELMTKASALAADLRARGVTADVPVGLCTPRTTDFVVGLVGILLAGGAFVPMDPAVPEAMRAGMLAQAGATLTVHVPGGHLVVTGTGAPAAAVPPSLDHLAYVIFTSGSTGAPKGVAIEHRALANYVASIIEHVGMEPGAQHAMVSTIGADLGHTVLVPSLATGGTLHLLSHRDTTERARFSSYVREHRIDYLKIVPSHLAALIDAGDPVLPRKALILGGESSGSAWASDLARGSCRVFNHYGPTETTVGVMTCEVARGVSPPTLTLPLDRAVDNVAIWVLDEAMRPVPVGAPGEVYVSGASLARGYINDQARTAEKFVRLPGGTRAYRTGDVARQLPGGGLLLLGRDDRQVKLRGYRIELAQVEHALAAHPAVRQAVVLPDRDGAAAATLEAWVVPAAGAPAALDIAALQAWLAEQLPHYMLPSTIVGVPSIALTANGKVDVAALRATLPQARAESAAPMARDLVELRLGRIWMDVLDVARVSPGDDFFDLGGHSLRAVRMASRIHDEFGVDVPLTALFTHRTLEQLAALLRASTSAPAAGAIVPMQHGAAGRPVVVCFPGAGGNLLYFQDLRRRARGRCPGVGRAGRGPRAAGRDSAGHPCAGGHLRGRHRAPPVGPRPDRPRRPFVRRAGRVRRGTAPSRAGPRGLGARRPRQRGPGHGSRGHRQSRDTGLGPAHRHAHRAALRRRPWFVGSARRGLGTRGCGLADRPAARRARAAARHAPRGLSSLRRALSRQREGRGPLPAGRRPARRAHLRVDGRGT